MSLATRLSASSRRLIHHFSYTSTVVLTKLTGAALSATRGVTVTPTSATVACSTPTPYGAALRDGTRILDGDLRLYVWADDPALTFDPAAEMVAVLDGDSYRVMHVEKLTGAFELQLRGGGS